jgi:hypothetical protein
VAFVLCAYCSQLFATIFPLVTRSAGPLALASVDAALLALSITPVNSSFLPTCGVSAEGFAISRYVCALDAGGSAALDAVVPVDDAADPAVPAVVVLPEPVVPVGVVEPAVPLAAPAVSAGAGAIVAFVNTYFGADAWSDAAAGAPAAVPVVPVAVVPAVDEDPAVPAVVDADALDGASRRHPVTTTFCSLLDVAALLVCGAEVVCAPMTTLAHAAIAAHTLVPMNFFIQPPARRVCNRGAAAANETAALDV